MKKIPESKEEAREKKPGIRDFLPYFGLLRPHWLPFGGALLCGLVYGVASGFGLPTMIDQVFPKIFPTQAGATRPSPSGGFFSMFPFFRLSS